MMEFKVEILHGKKISEVYIRHGLFTVVHLMAQDVEYSSGVITCSERGVPVAYIHTSDGVDSVKED